MIPLKLAEKPESQKAAAKSDVGSDRTRDQRDHADSSRLQERTCASALTICCLLFALSNMCHSFDRVSRALTQFKPVKSTQSHHASSPFEHEKCVFYLQITIFQ